MAPGSLGSRVPRGRPVCMHAWALRLRRACDALAKGRPSQCCLPVRLTPSALLILAISELTISGYLAYMCPCPTLQVRGCPTALTWLGARMVRLLFLYDSLIHYFTPVYPDAIQAKAPAPQERKPLRITVGQTLSSVDPASQGSSPAAWQILARQLFELAGQHQAIADLQRGKSGQFAGHLAGRNLGRHTQ